MPKKTQRRRASEACEVLDQAMSGQDEHRPQDMFWWAQRGLKFRTTYGDVSAARDRGNNKILHVMKGVYEDAEDWYLTPKPETLNPIPKP